VLDGRKEKRFAATGLTCSYCASKFPVFSSVLRSAARLSVPPEFTVAGGNVFLASGLGKESDRGAQPYAFVVAFGREDAGVRLSVRCELAGLMAVAVQTMKPWVIKLLAQAFAHDNEGGAAQIRVAGFNLESK
jgi:hypothetical protein